MTKEHPLDASTPQNRLQHPLESIVKDEDNNDKNASFSSLSEVKAYIQKHSDPILFTFRALEQIKYNEEYNMLGVKLPIDMPKKLFLDDKNLLKGPQGYTQYWTIMEDETLEMILIPNIINSRLPQEAKSYLVSRYQKQVDRVYTLKKGGIILPWMEDMDDAYVELKSESEPWIHVNILSRPIKKKNQKKEDYDIKEKPISITPNKEYKKMTKNDKMKRFTIDETIKMVKTNSARTPQIPSSIMRQYLNGNYNLIGIGDSSKDFLLLYNKTQEFFDMILLPSKNYDIIMANLYSESRHIIESFSQMTETSIMKYDNDRFKLTYFPGFKKDAVKAIRYHAEEDGYIRIEKA